MIVLMALFQILLVQLLVLHALQGHIQIGRDPNVFHVQQVNILQIIKDVMNVQMVQFQILLVQLLVLLAQQELMADKLMVEQERQEVLAEQYNSRAQAYRAKLAVSNDDPHFIQVVFK